MLELAKANDRKRKIVRGNKLKAKGWVVIYERFPIANLFDFPNKLLKLKNHPWFSNRLSKTIRTLIHEIEKTVENLEKPDASFLIITDLEKMKERRVLAQNELIEKGLEKYSWCEGNPLSEYKIKEKNNKNEKMHKEEE